MCVLQQNEGRGDFQYLLSFGGAWTIGHSIIINPSLSVDQEILPYEWIRKFFPTSGSGKSSLQVDQEILPYEWIGKFFPTSQSGNSSLRVNQEILPYK